MEPKGTDREAGLTTDELASAGRHSAPDAAAHDADTTNEPLLAVDEATRFQSRWEQIQSMFVDEPQQSVQNADQLVAELMQHLTRLFAQEREGLERQWSAGGLASTEDLRVALRHYRSFFQRLLST